MSQMMVETHTPFSCVDKDYPKTATASLVSCRASVEAFHNEPKFLYVCV